MKINITVYKEVKNCSINKKGKIIMIQLTNIQSQTLLEVFEQLHLSKELIEKMEDYIDGKVGEEVLDQLPFQDLRRVYQSPSATLFLTLSRNGFLIEAKRYFNILFAIGGPSCSKILPDEMLTINRDKKLEIPMDKIVAVYAYENGQKQTFERRLKEFGEVLGKQIKWIEKALLYKNGQSENGKLILYTLYFFLKYSNHDLGILEKESEIGIIKLLDKKKIESLLSKEDQELMQEYEECMCRQVNDMLNQGLLSEEIQKIAEGLHQKDLSEETEKLVKRHTVVFQVVKQATGLAFVNFALSNCLKNFVSLSLKINRTAALNGMEAADIRQDLKMRGGNFDEIFGINTEKYIRWAAEKSYKKILQTQFLRNREIYISCCDTMPASVSNQMLDIIKEQDFLYYLEKKKQNQDAEQEKIIKAFIRNSPVADTIDQYLRREVEIEQLYLCEDQMNTMNYNWSLMYQYCHDFGEDEFYRRSIVLIAIAKVGYFFRNKMYHNTEEETKRIFAVLEQERMDLIHQIRTFVMIGDVIGMEETKEKYIHTAKQIFARYLSKQRETMLTAFQETDVFGRQFALKLFAEQAQENKAAILAYSRDSSKLVREVLLKILYQQTDWEEEVKQFLKSKKAVEREIAIRVLARWDRKKYQSDLEQALEKEKNHKIQILLSNILQVEQKGEEVEKVLTQEDLVRELHRGGRSRTLAWAYQTPFSVVHKKSGEEAPKEYLQAIFLCYSSMQPCGIHANAAFLAEGLHTAEFAVYVNELFDKWIDTGAEAKKRWVLFAASIHGGMAIIKKLQHQIQEWSQYARGAIAANAVQALALNPDPQALLIVDGIARKFKFKQVKSAAGKALDFAAAQLGLEREELEDRIVPDLGFDEHMERKFDYGERTFTVTVTTMLEMEVFDENGKKLKNLPAPGKKDDAEKAAAAYEEFKQMKKQMKTTISSQKTRLEWALFTERVWSVEAWEALFVKNPLMHPFAIGLIWGIYRNGTLVQSFRYMEDGTFNTEEEEEFVLPEDGKIGLVHPIELSEESRITWKEQLEDYEIVQPIVQLEREIFYPTEEEKELRSLERFGGCMVNDLSLGGKLQALGWYRGEILDAGGFYTFYREDTKIGYGVELHFSGSFVGSGSMGDVTIYDARFYKIGGIERGSYSYNKVERGKGILLSEIPKRYFSEIVLQIAMATASSKDRDEEWRRKV